MKRLASISQIVFLGLMVLVGLTIYGIRRSEVRTECYRTHTSAAECSSPDAVERFLRWLYS